MNTRVFSIITLTLLVSVTLFSRFWKIGNLPPSLFADEVDIGYQAMTFNHSQSDYFGNKFPLHFHSFSDWQPSFGIYAVALTQKLTNNPELSVRLPSAIFGSLSVFLIYLITGSIIPSFLLAISPWAIHYSRTGFAVSEMILFFLLGIYCWQKFLKTKKTFPLLLSVLFFCLTPYIYSTAKLFLIFLPAIFLYIWKKEIFQIPFRTIIVTVTLGLIILTPLAVETLNGKAGFRFSYISIFTEPHREQVTDNARYQDAMVDHPNEIGIKTTIISQIIHNKYQLVLNRFITNYLSSFSTEFLFLHGDANIRHGFGNFGLLYIIDIVFVFIGLIVGINSKTKLSKLFLTILLFAPIPFALTRDANSPHATRLILMLPSLIYFTSLGINQTIIKLKYSVFAIIIIYSVSFFSFFHYYYYHYPQESAMVWHTGMKEAVIATDQLTADKIYFSNKYEPFTPFFLFYKPFLPTNMTAASSLQHLSNDYFDGSTISNQYYFGHINWNNLPLQSAYFVIPKSEYVGINNQNDFTIIDTISKKYINSEEFYILKQINAAKNK